MGIIERVFMRHGFSLVELSIVLVILGLLTGGILTGQNLIRAAELRSVTTQMQRYQSSIYTFRDKYLALPGDMRNATDFWGSAGGNGTDNTCWAAQTKETPETCNGNGNGLVEGGIDRNIRENFLFWKHLSNSGLIEGSYLGRSTLGVTFGDCGERGTDCPASKLGNGVVRFNRVSTFEVPLHVFNFTTPESTTGPFAVDEAWGVDTKLDDGMPNTGKVRAGGHGSVSCRTVDDLADPAIAYDLASTNAACNMMIVAF